MKPPADPDPSAPLSSGAESDVTRIAAEHLINKLNFLNFMERPITVRFRHPGLEHVIRRQAVPEPCADAQARYRWTPAQRPPKIPPHYRFQDILVQDDQGLILVVPEAHRWDSTGGHFRLPPFSTRIDARRVRRYAISGIRAELIQNGIRFQGRLVDFSPIALKVDLDLGVSQSFSWICPQTTLLLILSSDEGAVFTGDCRLAHGCRETASLLLEPVQGETPRFVRKRHRSGRVTVTPAPCLLFRHPLIGRHFQMDVLDLSGTGLRLQAPASQDVLLPGMVIHQARLTFPGGVEVAFSAQVIHRRHTHDEGQALIQWGMAILEMSSRAHTRLLGMLYQVKEPNAYIDHPQDMDALWRFFFETGFIYPDKYLFFSPYKKRIQVTYEQLYRRHPDIARHFTYQRMGRVLGHMAMLRFYQRAWMIHHHAANTRQSHRAGLIVLEQIGRFINDSHRLDAACMEHVFCLYRPENRFPSRVFGSAARSIADPRICSTDTFAYLHYAPVAMETLKPVYGGWQLAACTDEDLVELQAAYQAHSGPGRLIQAFDLTPRRQDLTPLSQAYRSCGLERERRLFALRYEGIPAAVLMCNRSDVGLNMSDLTSGIQIFVIDPSRLTAHVLQRALARLAKWYDSQRFPLLVYPEEAAGPCGLAAEKRYTAWVLNLDYTDRYFDYVRRLIHITAQRQPRDQDLDSAAN